MHIGDTGTGSVVFVAQADIEGGHGTDPETVILIYSSTMPPT